MYRPCALAASYLAVGGFCWNRRSWNSCPSASRDPWNSRNEAHSWSPSDLRASKGSTILTVQIPKPLTAMPECSGQGTNGQSFLPLAAIFPCSQGRRPLQSPADLTRISGKTRKSAGWNGVIQTATDIVGRAKRSHYALSKSSATQHNARPPSAALSLGFSRSTRSGCIVWTRPCQIARQVCRLQRICIELAVDWLTTPQIDTIGRRVGKLLNHADTIHGTWGNPIKAPVDVVDYLPRCLVHGTGEVRRQVANTRFIER